MNTSDFNAELEKIKNELSFLPDAYLVYKTIRGKKQPYLQWHEDGKTKSRYIKSDEREEILIEIQKRDELLLRQKRLVSYREQLKSAWKKYPGLQSQSCMIMPVSIGIQSFSEIIEKQLFYIDKTLFIRDWWENPDKVLLITRPRRFGKSLNLDMLDCFFSTRYANRSDLFESLQIWQTTRLQQEQGRWPVLHLDFSNMKINDYEGLRHQITQCILNQYYQHRLICSDSWDTDAIWTLDKIESELNRLCRLLAERNNGRKVIILIDEYDTPLQEAWGTPFYAQTARLMRIVFHCLLKSNLYLEKALLTGITRISRESLFSDMNNLSIFSVTSDRFSEYFGFTEEEVFAAMDSQNLEAHEAVKRWYDGFTFGERKDIYNPWSITNYLQQRKFDTYWANTSANTLVSQLVGHASPGFKKQFTELMNGNSIEVELKENITWEDLENDERLIWGLLLCTGYITGTCISSEDRIYHIRITNLEVMHMFEELFLRWFTGRTNDDYLAFIHAMFQGDTLTMNETLSEIMLESFSYFDVSRASENRKTENFYHGFVLGMMSSLRREYLITSNRESGYGRYDIMIEPRKITAAAKAVIFEFKVNTRNEEKLSLEASASMALEQIERQEYAAQLCSHGLDQNQIYTYGIAFCGKEVYVKG